MGKALDTAWKPRYIGDQARVPPTGAGSWQGAGRRRMGGATVRKGVCVTQNGFAPALNADKCVE